GGLDYPVVQTTMSSINEERVGLTTSAAIKMNARGLLRRRDAVSLRDTYRRCAPAPRAPPGGVLDSVQDRAGTPCPPSRTNAPRWYGT
ncbi:hypothetical protein ABZ608_39175, partial [Streptomyces sp. NPDC013172]|uniref:hypothetical protein n=1 Tax=Streptomyces sp. NPDC013172 TaxID=3155009 RepID=UPI00340B72C3